MSEIVGRVANIEGPNQSAPQEQTDQGLHCLRWKFRPNSWCCCGIIGAVNESRDSIIGKLSLSKSNFSH